MSSLRITHQGQGRAIGQATAGGDAGRAAGSADGARFAAALGAAGLVPHGGFADTPPGDALGSPTRQRRPADTNGTIDGAVAAAVAAGLAAANPADASEKTAATVVADGGSTTAQTPSAIADGGPTALAADFASGDWGRTSCSTSAAPSAADPSAQDATSRANTAAADPSSDIAGSGGQATPEPAQTAGGLPGAILLVQPDAPAPAPVPGGIATADNLAAGLVPADPSPRLGPSGNSPPRPDAPPSLLAALSGSLSPVVDDPGADRGTGGGAKDRARFASAGAPPASGNETTIAAPGTAEQVPALAAGPGTATATSTSAAGALPDHLTDALVRLVSSGSREMVIRLHPAELGDLTVRVAVNGRDVTAWFASPQPQVQNAINAAIGQLQTGLGNAGYNLNGAWVGADASSAWQQPARDAASPARPSGIGDLPSAGIAGSSTAASGMSIYV
jgi:flagellar hook-length control protein FliK